MSSVEKQRFIISKLFEIWPKIQAESDKEFEVFLSEELRRVKDLYVKKGISEVLPETLMQDLERRPAYKAKLVDRAYLSLLKEAFDPATVRDDDKPKRCFVAYIDPSDMFSVCESKKTLSELPGAEGEQKARISFDQMNPYIKKFLASFPEVLKRFLVLLQGLQRTWKNPRERVLELANECARKLKEQRTVLITLNEEPSEDDLARIVEQYRGDASQTIYKLQRGIEEMDSHIASVQESIRMIEEQPDVVLCFQPFLVIGTHPRKRIQYENADVPFHAVYDLEEGTSLKEVLKEDEHHYDAIFVAGSWWRTFGRIAILITGGIASGLLIETGIGFPLAISAATVLSVVVCVACKGMVKIMVHSKDLPENRQTIQTRMQEVERDRSFVEELRQEQAMLKETASSDIRELLLRMISAEEKQVELFVNFEQFRMMCCKLYEKYEEDIERIVKVITVLYGREPKSGNAQDYLRLMREKGRVSVSVDENDFHTERLCLAIKNLFPGECDA